MRLTIEDYWYNILVRASCTKERHGQAAYNYLSEIRPDLASQVTGTDLDPFYIISTNDPRWDRFAQFIESNW